MNAEGRVLDAGLFIAIERRDERAVALVGRWLDAGRQLVTSAGVVAQIWRGGTGRQVPVARLLRRTDVVDIDDPTARLLGLICGTTSTADVVDAHVVALARQLRWPVVTSDPDDMRKIDPGLRIGVV